MPIASLSLDCPRGSARVYQITHQTNATDVTPIDISGWTIRVSVKDSAGVLILQAGTQVTDGPNGKYTWTVNHGDSLLPPGPYAIDVQRIDAGSESAIGYGTWIITPDVLY